jgi:carboxypeptidase C (cathepsin A)
MSRAVAFVVTIVLATSILPAQTTTTQAADPTARTTTRPATAAATTQVGEKGDRLVVTEHELKVGDRMLRYTATAGTMAQKDENGATKADMFFVAYTLNRGDDEKSDATTRPVTFVFTGGPGAASGSCDGIV